MLVRTRSDSEPRASEITPRSVYLNRRQFIRAAGATAAGLVLAPALGVPGMAAPKFGDIAESVYGADEDPTPFESVTAYNNFYEFSTGKEDPAENSGDFKP